MPTIAQIQQNTLGISVWVCRIMMRAKPQDRIPMKAWKAILILRINMMIFLSVFYFPSENSFPFGEWFIYYWFPFGIKDLYWKWTFYKSVISLVNHSFPLRRAHKSNANNDLVYILLFINTFIIYIVLYIVELSSVIEIANH